MKKGFLLFVFFFVSFPIFSGSSNFKVYLETITPIEMSIIQNLSFPAYYTGSSVLISTDSKSARAAIFKANGESEKGFIVSVTEKEIVMNLNGIGNSSSEKIIVSNFVFGGDVSKEGIGYFDSNGSVNNIRIGASAYIKKENKSGNYYGTASLRIVYL